MRKVIMIVLFIMGSAQIVSAQNEDFDRIDIDGFAHHLSVSPDGQLVATYANSFLLDEDVILPDTLNINIYSIESGDLLHILSEATDFTTIATFSPDNTLLATAHWNGVINLWDVNTGERLETLYGTNGTYPTLVFAQDGRLLISRTQDQISQYLFWDLSSFGLLGIMTHRFDTYGQFRDEVAGLYDQMARLSDVAATLSPDEKQLITASQTGAIWSWDLENPLQNPTLLMEGGEIPTLPIRNLYFMSDSESVIFYFDRQKDVMEAGLYQLTLSTGEVTMLTDAYEMVSLALSDDGNVIAWGDRETSMLSFAPLSDLDNIQSIDLTTEGYSTRAWGLFADNFQFIDDDQMLIVGGFHDDEFESDFLYLIDVPIFDN